MGVVGLTRIERGVAAFVAVLLLAVQLAIPPGFMVARGADGPSLVICTGHGPMMAHQDAPAAPGKAPHSKSSPACPFAGHGGAPLAPPTFIPTAVETAATIGVDLAPGRGLAAPPPPSHAPPLHLI